MARILPEQQFGVAVLVIGALYVLQTVQRSLILYPLSLRVAAARDSEIADLAVSGAALSLPLSLVLGLILAGVSIALSHPSPAGILVLLVLTSQSHELLRSIFQAQLRHRGAVLGDVLRYGCGLGLLAILSIRGVPTVGAAFACMAAGAAFGTVWQGWRLSLRHGRRASRFGPGRGCMAPRQMGPARRVDRRRFGANHVLEPGRVARGGRNGAHAGSGQPAWRHASRHVRVRNPDHPRRSEGIGSPRRGCAARPAVRYSALGFLVVFPYLAFLFLSPGFSLSMVYGATSDDVTEVVPLRWFVAIYAMIYLQMAAKAALNGLGRSRDVSIVSCASLLLQVVIVMPLAMKSGLLAACLGSFIGNAVDAALAIRFLDRAAGTTSPVRNNTPEFEESRANADS